MKTKQIISGLVLLLGAVVLLTLTARPAYAHCDKLDGPVATAAREALGTGDFTTILIWVGPEQEADLRSAFQQALTVRGLNTAAQSLADRYFIETAVRLHRAAEGMPFDGVKPAGIPNPPDIMAGDQALQTGDIEPVLQVLQAALRQNVTRWYREAQTAQQQKAQSVDAGREWVDAYVQYIVYVHQLYQQIQAPPAHGVGD